MRDFFLLLFCLDLVLFAKIKKDLASTHWFFTLLLINQDLNKKKNPVHAFLDITKKKTCAKFQQKILNSIVVGARQSFNFSDKNPSFLEIIEVCLNLGIEFCIT